MTWMLGDACFDDALARGFGRGCSIHSRFSWSSISGIYTGGILPTNGAISLEQLFITPYARLQPDHFELLCLACPHMEGSQHKIDIRH